MNRRSAPSLRVLYLQPADAFGGAERQAATLMPLLAEHGIEVVPLVGPGETIVDWLRARGIHDAVFSRDFPENMPSARGLSFLGVPFRYARSRARIAQLVSQLVRERQIDLVYAALPFAWLSATAPARRLGVPIVWRAGGPQLYARGLGHAVFGAWARRNPPDLLVCSSAAVRATFAAMVPAPMSVVLNGVDLEQFQPPAERAADPTRGPTVGFAARLVESKGLRDFLAVAARMASTRPDARFLIAGDGPRRAGFERLAGKLGAGRNTRFVGYVDDMRKFYADCDVFVLPSRFEGCPNVLIEAMAMGLPVVASDLPGIREVATAGLTALLVEPGDSERLHAAIAELCGNPDARRSLGAAGLACARANFDARVTAARLATLLHDSVGRRADA